MVHEEKGYVHYNIQCHSLSSSPRPIELWVGSQMVGGIYERKDYIDPFTMADCKAH